MSILELERIGDFYAVNRSASLSETIFKLEVWSVLAKTISCTCLLVLQSD